MPGIFRIPALSQTAPHSTKACDNVAITLNVPTAGTYDLKYAVKLLNMRGLNRLSVIGVNVGVVEDEHAAAET
jgi:hypothetical protein